MRTIFPVTVTVFFLSLFLVQVIATHVSSVSVSPQESIVGTDADFKLLVKNQDGAGINSFELTLPLTASDQPSYAIKEISSPAGWIYNFRYKVGSTSPYKAVWSTGGAGITEGKSLEFSFIAAVPSTLGEFKWTWKTVDTAGDAVTDTLVTRTVLSPFAAFKLTVPQSVKAGEYFTITVAAVDDDGNIKTDHVGTVNFVSSDDMSFLPADYTFKAMDAGSKEFTLKFKTAGNQTVTVKDGKISLTSDNIFVKPGDAIALEISPEDSEVKLGDATELKAIAHDIFGNAFDVTSKSNFTIDAEAKGVWVGNFYKSEIEGAWTIVAKYDFDNKTLVGGTGLTVTKAAAKPKEVPKEENKSKEVLIGRMSISLPEKVMIEEGKNATLNLTVKNTGTLNLKDVSISASGITRDWIKISPLLADIVAGKSYNYVMTISVPQNTTGEKIVKLSATSLENITAAKEMILVAGKSVESAKGITGLIIAIISKPFYLGIIIVMLIVVILIVWALWPKGGKKKKSEE